MSAKLALFINRNCPSLAKPAQTQRNLQTLNVKGSFVGSSEGVKAFHQTELPLIVQTCTKPCTKPGSLSGVVIGISVNSEQSLYIWAVNCI